MAGADLVELDDFLREMGQDIPQGAEAEASRRESERLLAATIRTYLRSYEHVFEGEPVKVVTRPVQLFPMTAEYQKLSDAIRMRYDPRAVIIWMKGAEKFYGIFIPEVYKTREGPRVSLWFKGVPPVSYATGAEIVRVIAFLESPSLARCGFPSRISFLTEFSDGSRGGVTPLPGELGILEEKK